MDPEWKCFGGSLAKLVPAIVSHEYLEHVLYMNELAGVTRSVAIHKFGFRGYRREIVGRQVDLENFVTLGFGRDAVQLRVGNEALVCF